MCIHSYSARNKDQKLVSHFLKIGYFIGYWLLSHKLYYCSYSYYTFYDIKSLEKVSVEILELGVNTGEARAHRFRWPCIKYSGWTISHQLCVTHPDDHVFYSFLNYNLFFPSLIPVTSLIMLTNNGPVLRESIFSISKLSLIPDVPKNYQSYSRVVQKPIVQKLRWLCELIFLW